MATLSDDCFDRKARDAAPARPAMPTPMINQHDDRPRMGHPAAPGADLGRRLHVHRRRGPACRAADLCLAAADASPRARMWLFLKLTGERLDLPRAGVGLDPAAGAAQQCLALHPVRLGPDAYRQRACLDPQRDDADLGRARRPSLHAGRADDAAQDRRRAARLRRRRDDDRADAAGQRRHRRAGPAGLHRRGALLCPRRRSGRGGSGAWAFRRCRSRPAS